MAGINIEFSEAQYQRAVAVAGPRATPQGAVPGHQADDEQGHDDRPQRGPECPHDQCEVRQAGGHDPTGDPRPRAARRHRPHLPPPTPRHRLQPQREQAGRAVPDVEGSTGPVLRPRVQGDGQQAERQDRRRVPHRHLHPHPPRQRQPPRRQVDAQGVRGTARHQAVDGPQRRIGRGTAQGGRRPFTTDSPARWTSNSKARSTASRSNHARRPRQPIATLITEDIETRCPR
jgi:hypothetical protein